MWSSFYIILSSFLFFKSFISFDRFLVSSIFFQVFISSYFNNAILLAKSYASLSILYRIMININLHYSFLCFLAFIILIPAFPVPCLPEWKELDLTSWAFLTAETSPYSLRLPPLFLIGLLSTNEWLLLWAMFGNLTSAIATLIIYTFTYLSI